MGDNTGIEWTDATWNPVVGCSIVSPGCTNCYAMKQAARMLDGNPRTPHYAGTTKSVNGQSVWTGQVALAPDHILAAPLRWKKPRRIFVNSMGDLFHESVPDAWIDRVFAVMLMAPQHTFQVLTKRSKRMREWVTRYHRANSGAALKIAHPLDPIVDAVWAELFLSNVWLGVSCEDQTRGNERVLDLLSTPAAKHFVSAEPLLGQIDFRWIQTTAEDCFDALAGGWYLVENGKQFPLDGERLATLDWIIAGGESGPGARPMHPEWARSIRDQCQAAGVPFFFKQWGNFIDADEMWRRIKALGTVTYGDSAFDPVQPLNFTDAAIVADLANATPEHWSSGHTSLHVGKSRAGNLLDGKQHMEFPR